MTNFDESIEEFDHHIRRNKNDCEAFFVLDSVFQEIINRRLYIHKMNAVLRSVLDRATRTNALLTAGTFMSLHSSVHSTWIVMEHRRRSQFLYMTPVHSFQSPISGPGYAVERYRVIGDSLGDRIGGDTMIELVHRERIKTREVLKKSALGEVIDVLTEESEGRSFSLRVSSTPLGPFQINFDRVTRRVFGLTPVNPMLSNLTTIFDLLADASSTSSIDYLEPFAQHDQHFVRWHAMRAVYAIDETAGLKLIERACSDPHQHVRAAAIATLSRMPLSGAFSCS